MSLVYLVKSRSNKLAQQQKDVIIMCFTFIKANLDASDPSTPIPGPAI